MKQTNILIVDDSLIFRSVLEEALSKDQAIRVIGSVRNGKKAIEFIRSMRPDIVTLDMEMPEMDGLKTLEMIQNINSENSTLPPIGVIMVSNFTQKGADITIQALETGAYDFVTKPQGVDIRENIDDLCQQLIAKIHFYMSGTIPDPLPHIVKRKTIEKVLVSHQIRAILIGVSTGGPKVLMTLLPDVCNRIEIPVFIVQHMPATFTQSLADSLNAKCSHQVVEAENGEAIKNKVAYIAPGGRHMLIRRRGADEIIVVNDQMPERGCRPSADVLFRSAVTVFGGSVIAIILTGMGNDGSRGIEAVKRAGGYVMAQDKKTSVVWGMPGSAVATGFVDVVLPINEIPGAVEMLIHKSLASSTPNRNR